MSHDKYFYGKKLYFLFIAPHNIYQKQKKNQLTSYSKK